MQVEITAESEFREVFTGLLGSPDAFVAASALAILAAHDLKGDAITETTYEVNYNTVGLPELMDQIERGAAELGFHARCDYAGTGTIVDVTLSRRAGVPSAWAEFQREAVTVEEQA